MRLTRLPVILMLATALVTAGALPTVVPGVVDARADDDDDDGDDGDFDVESGDDDDDTAFPLTSYRPSAADNVVLQWNEEALRCIRVTKPGPTVVARSLFVLHSATYDAWAGYDARATPTVTAGWRRQPSSRWTTANKRRAVSHAAHTALLDLFPDPRCRTGVDGGTGFDGRLAALGYSVRDTAAPAVEGRRAARAVLTSRSGDGANQYGDDPRGKPGIRYSDTTGYQPVNSPTQVVDPWRWQPLGVPLGAPTTTQSALTPQWGRVRPFVPTLLTGVFTAPDPTRLTPAEREALVDEVVAYSARLDDRQKVVAEYWADGPASELPPGHWNLFAQWVSRRHGQSLDTDVRMFFGLNGAMHDAAIAAWDLKYRYDFARPVTAVRESRRGQLVYAWAGPGRGSQWIPGEQWTPYQAPTFPTPPFPAYTSGHSTFSAAGAEYLRSFAKAQGRSNPEAFGASVTIPAGATTFEPNVPATAVTLTWPTFLAAADEAGISRQYGGIHWSIDDYPARAAGRSIGAAAFDRARGMWGTVPVAADDDDDDDD